MIDYANTLLSLIQSAACSARVPAGTDRRMCAHYTTNPLSNCVLGLRFSIALTNRETTLSLQDRDKTRIEPLDENLPVEN